VVSDSLLHRGSTSDRLINSAKIVIGELERERRAAGWIDLVAVKHPIGCRESLTNQPTLKLQDYLGHVTRLIENPTRILTLAPQALHDLLSRHLEPKPKFLTLTGRKPFSGLLVRMR
jgi:hypothetical protein